MIPTALPGGAGGGSSVSAIAPLVATAGVISATTNVAGGLAKLDASALVPSSLSRTRLLLADPGKTVADAGSSVLKTLMNGGAFTIGAGTSAVGDVYEIFGCGNFLNNSGGIVVPSMSLQIGGDTTSTASNNHNTSTNPSYWVLRGTVLITSTGAVVCFEFHNTAAASAAPQPLVAATTNIGPYAVSFTIANAWTIDLKGSWGSTPSSTQWVSQAVLIEKLVV